MRDCVVTARYALVRDGIKLIGTFNTSLCIFGTMRLCSELYTGHIKILNDPYYLARSAMGGKRQLGTV